MLTYSPSIKPSHHQTFLNKGIPIEVSHSTQTMGEWEILLNRSQERMSTKALRSLYIPEYGVSFPLELVSYSRVYDLMQFIGVMSRGVYGNLVHPILHVKGVILHILIQNIKFEYLIKFMSCIMFK